MVFIVNLLNPDPGLFFWTVLVFIILWTLLAKFAFGPISKALKKREETIADALQSAEKAKAEMAALKADNEELIRQAQEERANILREAKAAKDKIINEAKDQAKEEATKIVTDAKKEIENQKMAAIVDLKNTVGKMSIEISEKVLKRELKDENDQLAYATQLVDALNVN